MKLRKQLSESLKLLNKFLFFKRNKSHQNQFHKRDASTYYKKRKKKIVN